MIKNNENASGPSEAGWHKGKAAFQCHKEHQFEQVRKVVPAMVDQTPDPLGLGIMFHEGRAEWFRREFKTDTKTLKAMMDEMFHAAEKQKMPVSAEAKTRAGDLLGMYVEHYAMMPKPTPLAIEQDFGPAALHPGSTVYRTARPDDVSRYPEAGGDIFLGDLKTTSDDPNTIAKQYQLHGQTMLGMLVYRNDKNGEKKLGKARGYMLDIVKKPYTGHKAAFLRVPIFITDWQLGWFATDMSRTVTEASLIEWDSKVKRNPTACQRVIGRRMFSCPYLELCKHGRSATVKYQFADGKPLVSWKPEAGKTTPPWE